jgi:hypothetical protein
LAVGNLGKLERHNLEPFAESIEGHWVFPKIFKNAPLKTVHQVCPPLHTVNNMVNRGAYRPKPNIEFLIELVIAKHTALFDQTICRPGIVG